MRIPLTAFVVVACAAGLIPASATAQATGTGVISGVVMDAATSALLPGATVMVEGTPLKATTGRDGRFQIPSVPAGEHHLTVNYLGHDTSSTSLVVNASAVVTVEVLLRETVTVRESVTVNAGPILEGQARALNQQRTSPNIVNVISSDQIGQFPDANAAEATQRIPGVTIERDQGEGRYVAIRGTEPRLNSMLINGERIPSPEGDIRTVALDVIPTDLLDSIEVNKELTPDMDADAIGGAVNLITKSAPARPRLFGSIGGGYNRLMEDWGQGMFNVTGGRRFAGGKLGLIVTGSANDVNRGSDNFESEYADGDLDTFDLRDYTINRQRYGFNGAMDYQFAPGNSWTVRGVFNRFSDQEYRRAITQAISDEEVEWELKDRLEAQAIGSLSLTGQHLLRTGAIVDFQASWAYAEEDEPNAYYTLFRQEDVRFEPNVSPDHIDPDNIQPNPQNLNLTQVFFNEQSIDDNLTTDRDVVAAVNLRIPLNFSSGSAGSLKFGMKYRDKKKDRDASTTVFESDDELAMSAILDPTFDANDFYQGRYTFGPFFGADAARALNTRLDMESEADPEADLSDYNAAERVTAGYAMADMLLGPKATLIAGVRVEHTGLDYSGVELAFDDEGDFAGMLPVSNTASYTQLLPGAHLRYAVTPDINVRAAVTRSLARPNYYDLVPYQLILEEDHEIERGNSALTPSTSWNFDLMAERYFRPAGMLSAGFFRKSIADFIFPFRYSEVRGGDEYEVTQPQNGDSASVTGIELALQNQLHFLPAPFDGLGVYANYTYTTSSAKLPERDDRNQLPGQVRHSGNLAGWYENGSFSARLALNFRGSFLSEVGGDAAEDVFVDRHHQLDLSVSHALTRSVRVFADVLNLTNQPLRLYENVADRPIQEEYYRWSASFGARFTF